MCIKTHNGENFEQSLRKTAGNDDGKFSPLRQYVYFRFELLWLCFTCIPVRSIIKLESIKGAKKGIADVSINSFQLSSG